MDRKEINEEIKMSYNELIDYLIKKYGGAKYNYFTFISPHCWCRNHETTRTKEGLFCHHIDEDKGDGLSHPSQATLLPFAWQKKERLVYCNILEHLILHIKITVLRQKKKFYNPGHINTFLNAHRFFTWCQDINEMFMENGTTDSWKKRCYEKIRENYEDYINLLKATLKYIDTDYCGERKGSLIVMPDSVGRLFDCNYKIYKTTPNKGTKFLKTQTGENKKHPTSFAIKEITYYECIDNNTRKMSSSSYGVLYERIYCDVVTDKEEETAARWAEAMKVDFHGYGYMQYANILLPKTFNAINADEYISHALPMYSDATIALEGKTPVFWSGQHIQKKEKLISI